MNLELPLRAALIGLVITIFGCVSSSEQITLNADGSGSYHMTSSMSARSADAYDGVFGLMSEYLGDSVELMNSLLMQKGLEPMEDLFEYESMHPFTQASLDHLCALSNSRLMNYSDQSTDTISERSCAIEFSDLDGLNKILDALSSKKSSRAVELRRVEDARYQLNFVDYTREPKHAAPDDSEMAKVLEDQRAVIQARADSLAAQLQEDPELKMAMLEFMGATMSASDDFEVSNSITVPGAIFGHNATVQDGRTVTWTFHQGQLVETITEGLASAMADSSRGDAETGPWVAFSSEGLRLPEISAEEE